MKLYSRYGADSVEHGDAEYKADRDGGIEVPEELGLFLHNQHIGGQRAWENDAERQVRLDSEEHALKSDPAYLAKIVEELSAKVDAQPVKKTVTKKAETVESAPVKKTSATK
jgi:hypothetical protein